MEKFPIFNINGNAREKGLQQGKLLKERIERTIDFYRKVFRVDENQILEEVRPFIKSIREFDREIANEIEGIAGGSGIDEKWIYALNCRTELLGNFTNECTAIYFPKSGILGQNWDWAKELENLAVFLKIKENDGTQILMMTEPGIIGKIGFNSHGLGVTLNLLKINQKLSGVPIHVILRSILKSRTIEEALAKIEMSKQGKSSNIVIGTGEGRFVDIEFAGNRTFTFDKTENIWIHTNHFLGEPINTDPIEFASSFSRYRRSNELIKTNEGRTVEDMKEILLDRENNAFPICRKYVQDDYIDNVGTVTTLIMDLRKRKLHFTRGSPLENPFEQITI